MSPPGRFERLEGEGGQEEDVAAALARLGRFEHLEIGELPARPPAPPAASPPPPPKAPAEAAPGRIVCPHCSQANEPERELCWACFRRLTAAEAAAKKPTLDEVTIVLDGITYDSKDPGVPDDVRALMERIRTEGYSQELLVEWRSWRATRRQQIAPSQTEDTARDVHVFQGSRVTVIRLDGKVYKSDDAGLSEEMRRLFSYVERNGVTPALLEYLRQYGRKVQFRPGTTAEPSDGDIRFWQEARAKGAVPTLADFERTARTRSDVEAAEARFQSAKEGALPALLFVIAFVIYALIRFL